MRKNEPAQVSVIDEEAAGGPCVIARFETIRQAEYFLATSATIGPDQLKRGGYGIDAPETMVNPCRETMPIK